MIRFNRKEVNIDLLVDIIDVNLKELIKAIDIYEHETGKTDLYLIMSYKTASRIAEMCNTYLLSKDYGASFQGFPIAICDRLKYGEVEIR